MIRKTMLAAVAIAALAACKPAADKASPEGAAPAAPAQASGDWFLTMDPAGHTLEFKANGDTQVSDISLSCVPGTNKLTIKPAPATLTSGAASATYAAGTAGLSDPVFAAFRENGSLEITQGGTKKVLRGSAEGGFAVGAFFQFCSNPN